MHYSICPPADPSAASIFKSVLASLGGDRQMQADVAKLDRACCASTKLVLPEGAPRPFPTAPSPESQGASK
jgi:hypothetical protein